MVVILPGCRVCGAGVDRIVTRNVYEAIAWDSGGAVMGWTTRDYCLDCEEKERKAKEKEVRA